MSFFRNEPTATESADVTHPKACTSREFPKACTSRNWATLYFRPWLESLTSGLNPKVDPRIVWTAESIFKFFELKDQEYRNRIQPGILRGFCWCFCEVNVNLPDISHPFQMNWKLLLTIGYTMDATRPS